MGVLSLWGSTVEQSPRQISAFLYIGAGEAPFAQATIVFAGDDTDTASEALGPFVTLPGMRGHRAHLTPYASVPLTTNAPHIGQQQVSAHTGLAVHLGEPVASSVSTLLGGGSADMVQIRSVGGAINDVPADATAYAHRHQNFSVTAVSAGEPARFHRAWDPVREVMDGMYFSFESDHAPDRIVDAFPPTTLERLRSIKRQWDPDGVFTQNFDVGVLAD
jgi:hypothetical protein